MSANQLWSFIRNFTRAAYYSTPQAGALTGTSPFTFGAIFATVNVPASGFIFTTGAVGTGFAIVQSGTALDVANGTVIQRLGTINNITGAVLADATDPVSTQNLANAYKSNAFAGATVQSIRGSHNPHSVQLSHVTVTVAAGGNQLLYCNGHLVHTIAAAPVASTTDVFIGIDSTLATAATNLWIAGCYYRNAVYSAAEIAAMHAACVAAKDVVGPGGLVSSAVAPDYMWSVKRGNYDARANWVSDGSAATPLPMVRTGSFTFGTADSAVLAADVPLHSL